jgi:ABC-2 family transporter
MRCQSFRLRRGDARAESSMPTDTLFGRTVTDSGFAIPLVVLGFGALWPFAVLASIVGGDVFSAEDRHGTWKTVLTRSRSRGELFAGKVIAAFAFSVMALAVFGASSIRALREHRRLLQRTVSGESRGGPTLRTIDGRSVRNLLYAFEGCSDTT